MDERIFNAKLFLYDEPELDRDIEFFQNDTKTCVINIELFKDRKTPYSVDGSVAISINKNDGNVVVDVLTKVDEGKYIYKLPNSAINVVGSHKVTIQCNGIDNNRVTFISFKYRVKSDVSSGDISSESEFPVLTKLLSDNQVLNNEFNMNENERIINENRRIINEEKRLKDYEEASKEYDSYRNVMISESNVAALQSQINASNAQLEQNTDNIDTLNKNKSNYYPQKWYNNDFILYVSYLNNERKIYVSQDGLNVKKISKINIDELWDISSIFYNDYFYIIGDIKDESYNDYNNNAKLYDGGGNRIPLYKTNDFINYEKSYVNIPIKYKQTWAPDWVIDSKGDLYITVSMSDGSETYEWVNSKGVKYPRYKKYIYIIKCNFNSNTGFFDYEEPIKISLRDNEGLDINDRIDPFIFYDDSNSKYYLTAKQRNGQYVQLYKSNSISNGYELIKEFKNIPQFEQGGEGSSIIKYNNIYYLYIQSTDQLRRTNYLYITDSLDNINTPPYVVNNEDGDIMMHFTPLVIKNKNAKNIIGNFLKNNGCDVFNDNKKNISGYLKVIKNDLNGYATYREEGNLCCINFKIKNDNGFANYEELFTIPLFPISRLDFIVGVSDNYYSMKETSPNNLAHIFINDYGIVKLHFNKNDTNTYKFVTGDIVFFKNAVYS